MVFPLLAIAAGIGVGLTAFGAIKGVGAAKKEADISKQMTGTELAIEAQRQKAMELDARRKQIEMVRQAQRARALALTTASAQGAQDGSVLAGAYGSIQGQTGFNLEGVQQNLAIGESIFGLNQQIAQQKMKMADVGAEKATSQGISSLGGALIQNLPGIKGLGGNLFG